MSNKSTKQLLILFFQKEENYNSIVVFAARIMFLIQHNNRI